MFKDMFKTSMFLFVICALAGLLLAYCEEITAPAIKAIQEKIEAEARTAVLPMASKFEALDNVVRGLDGDGKLVGTVINVKPVGYAGEINMLVGIDLNGSVLGTKILSHSETPGLGAKLVSQEYVDKFAQLLEKEKSPIFKVTSDGGHVDAITAATISSKAFCEGIQQALEIYKNIENKSAPQKEVANE